MHPHGDPPSHPPTFSPGNPPNKHPKVSPSHPQILVFSIVTHLVPARAPLERCLVSDHLQTRLAEVTPGTPQAGCLVTTW